MLCYAQNGMRSAILGNHLKVIPQNCTVHPVLLIRCVNIYKLVKFATFKYEVSRSYTPKQFSKHIRKVVNDNNSLRISVRIPKTWRILSFRSTKIKIHRYNVGLLLNKHSDLYFFFHNFGVQIMPFNTKKLNKNSRKGKQI